MAGSETLGGTRPVKLLKAYNSEALALTRINDSGGVLNEGDQVILKIDGTVDIRDAGTEFPFGIVTVGGADGEEVTVITPYMAIVKGNAVAAGSAGIAVKPDGTRTNGLADYVVTAALDFVSVIQLTQTIGANEEARFGILNSPYKDAAS